jgi:hypothetical protein
VPNRLLQFFGFVVVVVAAPLLAVAQSDPAQIVRAAIQKKYPALKEVNLNPQKQPRTRDLNAGALIAVVVDNDPKTAEAFLRRSYATQDMDLHSHGYGQLKWVVTDARVTDFNAIEFGSLPMGPLLLKYRDQLSPEFLEWLKPHLKASLVALKQHRVATSYTNIWIMNAVNLMLMGQATNDSAAVAEGEHRIDEWIAFTQKNGIGEFDSPTYYGTDLNSLSIGMHYVASESERQKLAMILHYFWTDVAANYFAPAQKLAGPYSRDYDFLFGAGDLDTWLASIGLAPASVLSTVGPDGILLLDHLTSDSHAAPADVMALAKSGPREVQSSWAPGPVGNRWNWQGNSVAMGSTSGSHGEQDKLFAATFAGPRDVPQVIVDVDVHDSPYGLYRQRDKNNHPKPIHLASNLGSVQSGGLALLTLDIDPSKLPEDAKGITTNFVFPSEGSVCVDGKSFDSSSENREEIEPKSVVTISRGGATVAIRLLRADGIENEKEEYSLVADSEGLAHHAMKLRLVNLGAGAKPKSEHIRVAFLVAAADDAKPDQLIHALASATVHDDLNADTWDVSVTLPGKSLEVIRSLSDRADIIGQKVDGKEVVPELLSVNGKDLTAQIWK